MKKTEKITIVYFGDINSLQYPTKTISINTLEKYYKEKSKNLKDIAFLLIGKHQKITSLCIPSEKKYSVCQILSHYNEL